MADKQPEGERKVHDLDQLFFMLRQRRPHGSDGEAAFVEEFLIPLGVERDEFGNVYKQIGESPIVWCSHVDTVHDQDGRQLIAVNKEWIVKLHPSSKSNCLGADDTAGVWLMAEMIRAEKPGLYIFHRGEEKGCLGSKWLADKNKGLVKDRKCMIALDRKGYASVITKQMGGRCCSEDFAKSLSRHMDGSYKPDDTGSVTDSAHYTDLIGECTNLSVGYRGQHWKDEDLHVPHLLYVRDKLLKLADDPSVLTFKREPGDTFERYKSYTYNNTGTGWKNNAHWKGGSQKADTWYEFDEYPRRDFKTWYVNHAYVGGYWKDDKWVGCNCTEWEKQRKRFVSVKKAEAKSQTKVTTVVKDRKEHVNDAPTDVDAAMLAIVYMYSTTLTRMFMDWGFDADMLRSCMAPFGDEAFKLFVKIKEGKGNTEADVTNSVH